MRVSRGGLQLRVSPDAQGATSIHEATPKFCHASTTSSANSSDRSRFARTRERSAGPSPINSGPWVNECGYLNPWCGSDPSVVSLRAAPFHGYAIQVTVGLTNEFGSAPNRGVWMAVETPLRILLEGTIFGFWKAAGFVRFRIFFVINHT